MENEFESFKINVDLLEGQPAVEILVIPSVSQQPNDQDSTFVLVLDGVTLSVIKHNPDFEWYEIEGSLDQIAIDKIGKEINNYYM